MYVHVNGLVFARPYIVCSDVVHDVIWWFRFYHPVWN